MFINNNRNIILLTIFIVAECVLAENQGFEKNVTWYKVLAMIASHLVMAIGIWLFYIIGMFGFAFFGALTNLMSFYYHIVQLGIIGHRMLLLTHIGDYTFILVTFTFVILSTFETNPEVILYSIALVFMVPFFVGSIMFNTYIIVFLLVGCACAIVTFRYLGGNHIYKKKLKMDTFTLIGLGMVILFAAVGGFFIYWGGDPGDEHYWWRHDIWHFFAFGAYDFIALIFTHKHHNASLAKQEKRLLKGKKKTKAVVINNEEFVEEDDECGCPEETVESSPAPKPLTKEKVEEIKFLINKKKIEK